MANYNPWFFTPMYLSADQGAAITSEAIKFKRMVTTQDKLTVEDLPGMDNKVLETVKIAQSVGISSVVKKDNKVTVSAVFSNDKLTEGYDVNTVFLMAEYKDREFLAAITVANNAWHMSGTSDAERLEWTLKVTIATSNTEHISIEVDPTAVVINEQLDNTKREITETIAIERERIDDLEVSDKSNVKTTGEQDVKGVKRSLDLIQGTITKALIAVKLETARKINGVLFDGSKDIMIYAPTERMKLKTGANLNDIRDEGLYHVVDNNRAITIVNNPYAGDTPSFYLTVFEADGYVRQETWHYFQNNWRFARTFSKSENKWREWERVGS